MNTNLDPQALRRSWDSWSSFDLQRAGSPGLQLLWTALLTLTVAAVVTALSFVLHARGWSQWADAGLWARTFGRNLVISACVAFLIHGLLALGERRLGGAARLRALSAPRRALFFAGLSMLGVALGWPLGLWLVGLHEALSWRQAGLSLALSLLLTAIIYQGFSTKTRMLQAERQASEAQLRLLQAQIEPHFLFNTLANVHSLMDHDLPKARAMLQDFTDYLRASLGALRSEHGPLSQELDLARSYLMLLQARMEDRLRFTIDADAAALAQPLPALLLQPLVENAVQHGLEPSVAGGSVQVRARIDAGRLVLEVRDDGIGHQAAASAGRRRRPGSGMGLANVRQRLQVRYGDAARLELLPAHPGTLARITLPLQPADRRDV